MRALVISHAAVIPANQAPYCEMERLPDIELALVVPRRWRASVGGMTDFERDKRLKSPTLELEVALNGRIQLHYYRGLSASVLPFQPDVVYADEDCYSAAGYQAFRLARGLGVPFVFKGSQNILKRYPPPFGWMERAVLRGAAAAIVIGPACGEVLRAKGYAGTVAEIGYGISPAVFRPMDMGALRAELGVEGFVVGYMGRLSSEKGVADLIAACTRLPESERGQLSLLVIGDGPQRPELEIQAASVPGLRAVFTGPVPHAEAQRYLNCFDVLVLPSRTTPAWREQFGRVIIEAMACGVPVVGSDSGHIPVLIEETGGGSVFPEGDSEALSERLAALASRPEEVRTLGEKGRVAVLERYTYGRIAGRIADVLRAAAGPTDDG